MAFQECMDGKWLLQKAGLADAYAVFSGREELCTAVRKADWLLLGHGQSTVAEDLPESYWRRRDVQWVRLRHRATGAAVLFLNHHGPLPINSGGVCGGVATAVNLLQVVAARSSPGDAVVLAGDFNADRSSTTMQLLSQRLRLVAAGWRQGGIDRILTNLGASAITSSAYLDGAGSDHDALGAQLEPLAGASTGAGDSIAGASGWPLT
mmetsp:Transcript_72842/g.201027  ORF Transcript_72842/g.201027 Transcript_72842/m.201027 type:complete len:208 (-) Transcript_72842:78-701(-)